MIQGAAVVAYDRDGDAVELGERYPSATEVMLALHAADGHAGVAVRLDLANVRALRDALDTELALRGVR